MPQLRAMRTLSGLRAARSGRPGPPSRPESPPLAAQRLAESLQRRTSEYRTDATIDLTMIDALLKHEGPEAAREALDDHTSSLDALLADLHAAVAEAAVERDVREALASEPPPQRPGVAERVRAHAVAAASAVALLLALVLPGPRATDPDTFFAGDDTVVSANDEASRTYVATARKAASAAAAGVRSAGTRWLRASDRTARSSPATAAAGASRLTAATSPGRAASGGTGPSSGPAEPPANEPTPMASTTKTDPPLTTADVPTFSTPEGTPSAPVPAELGDSQGIDGAAVDDPDGLTAP